MWNRCKIPTKADGSALWWSIMTTQDAVTYPDGTFWDGRKRVWIPANDVGKQHIGTLIRDNLYHAVYSSQALYFEPKYKHGEHKTPAGKSGVACLTHAWVDLDIYKIVPEWSGLNYAEKSAYLVGEIMAKGLPMPSLFVSSGRGAYLLWMLKEPLWNVSKSRSGRRPGTVIEAINKQFIRELEHLGADPKCADFSRILRVPGSSHMYAYGSPVAVMHDTGISYSIAELKSCLPWNNEQVSAHKKAKIERRKLIKKRALERAKVIDLRAERDKRNPGFTKRKYAHSIINDLRVLAGLRWDGNVPEGHRDIFGHLAVSAVARYHTDPETLLSETLKFAGDFIHDDDFESHNSTSVEMLKKGKCYAYRSDTMRQLLDVTTYEAESLSVLCSAKQKERSKKTTQRRKKGVQERSEYVSKSISQARPWEALGISRATYYRNLKSSIAQEPNSKEWQKTAISA